MNFRMFLTPLAGTAVFSYGRLFYKTQPSAVVQAGHEILNFHQQGVSNFFSTFTNCLEKDGFYASTPMPEVLKPIGQAWDLGVTKPRVLSNCYQRAWRKLILPDFLVKPAEYAEQGYNFLNSAIPALFNARQRILAFRNARA